MASSDASERRVDQRRDRLEFIAVLVLSVTTILTAWSAFQASKWGGAMSISFAQASSARIESASLADEANQRQSVHIGLWLNWLDAADTDPEYADALRSVFPEPLATATEDWLATDPQDRVDDEGGPGTPFAMPSYVLEERAAAEDASDRADDRFQQALDNNQRSDNYTLLTVLFAAVLFFSALSGRTRLYRSQVAFLTFAILLGLAGVALLLGFPKLI